MADRVIDYDRGVIINVHKQTGMDVFMYVDSPGKFADAHGNPVPDSIAAESGYDTEKLGKERLRLERKRQANALIDKELADEADTVEKTLSERNGFKLVTIGLGRHNVRDPEGNILNSQPMAKEPAQRLWAAMAGEDAKATTVISKK